jgi:hypothetical protein
MNHVINQSTHPEPFDLPFVLSVSKDGSLRTCLSKGAIHGSTSSPRTACLREAASAKAGRFHTHLFKVFVRNH